MHILLSPAKKQAFDSMSVVEGVTSPYFQVQADHLVSQLQHYTAIELAGLLGVSMDIAELNYHRFQQYVPAPNTANIGQAACFAYVGDTYKGLNIHAFTADDLSYAQCKLSILSGLYGVLRPLDMMQPYRLEMATKKFMDQTLYEYWAQPLTAYLNSLDETVILNLASQEYSSVIDKSKLNTRWIDVTFYQRKNGRLKVIGLLAKKARGQMASFVIRNRIVSPEGLVRFSEDGYIVQPDQSTPNHLVFIRDA